ncbi:MAG: hypothetical protein ACO3NF_14180, partial [Paracoccaceae bacterium]
VVVYEAPLGSRHDVVAISSTAKCIFSPLLLRGRGALCGDNDTRRPVSLDRPSLCAGRAGE